MLAGFCALVLLRLPLATAQGRFFAEEGYIFFASAWHFPAFDALFRPLGGYLNIGATVPTWIAASAVKAGLLDMAHAPRITQAFALLFQAIPAVLIIWSKASWLGGWKSRALALLLIAAIPSTEEVFLHTLHSQFHLALACSIILATSSERHIAWNAFRLGILVLAPLTGLLPIALLPLFLLRWWFERSRARLLECAFLGAGALLQLAFFFQMDGSRRLLIDPAWLGGAAIVRHVLNPLLGSAIAEAAGQPLFLWIRAIEGPLLTGLASLMCAGIAYALLRSAAKGAQLPWLLLAAALLSAVSYAGSIATEYALFIPNFGQRYTFVPQALIILAALGWVAALQGKSLRALRLVIAACLITSVFQYFQPKAYVAEGPDWRDQAAKWESNHSYRPEVWPESQGIDLSDTSSTCKPGDVVKTYCDAAWAELARRELQNFDK